jgi:C1A family cysteine protease
MKEIIEALGALKSPFDARDYKLVASATEVFPETFELPKVTVKNQGSQSSCVAHATSSIVEYHHKRQHNEEVVFSTEFIYGFRDIGYYVGDGMYIRNALNTLRKYGDVPLDDLRGNNNYQRAMKNVTEQLEELKDKAYPHHISSYFRLYDEGAVMSALMHHGYVIVGMQWHKDATLVDGVYTPTDKVSGGHAIVIYGWNEKGWLCQNSWGNLWGDKGRFIIPFDFKFTEMWGITDNITDDIVRPKRNKIRDLLYKVYNAIVNFFSSKEAFNEDETD